MHDIKNIPLVSSEISGLWNGYMSDSLSIRVLSYFLNNVKDEEVRVLLQQTLDLSLQHIPMITDLFNQEGLPMPVGFTDKDVNINAPRLFTDTFYSAYITFMARIGMHNYTMILNHISREDIRGYFSKRIVECIELYNKSTSLRLSKGIYVKAPHVEVPKNIEYVNSPSFLMDYFGEKRALLMREITHMFGLIFTNTMGKAVSIGFGQVSKDKNISDYFFKGANLSTKILSDLTTIFMDENIPIPSTSESFVTDSTISPFSEKLMMIHSIIMGSQGISMKGMAMADSGRSDLLVMYTKLMSEIMKYTEEGTKIAIKNKWLEQPPQAIKHKNLVGV